MDIIELKTAIESTISDIDRISANLKSSATEAANARSNYVEAKSKELIAMKAEEIKEEFKRTVQDREALYRRKLSDLRRESMIRDADYEGDRELFKGVLAKLNGLQTLVKIEKTDFDAGNFRP